MLQKKRTGIRNRKWTLKGKGKKKAEKVDFRWKRREIRARNSSNLL